MTSDTLAARGAPERIFIPKGADFGLLTLDTKGLIAEDTYILATALAASLEGRALIAEAEAANRALMMDALAALVSARDTIRRKWATTNPERERVIRALSEALDVEVVPAEAAALKGA